MTRFEETACDHLWRQKLDSAGSAASCITALAVSFSALLLAFGLS